MKAFFIESFRGRWKNKGFAPCFVPVLRCTPARKHLIHHTMLNLKIYLNTLYLLSLSTNDNLPDYVMNSAYHRFEYVTGQSLEFGPHADYLLGATEPEQLIYLINLIK